MAFLDNFQKKLDFQIFLIFQARPPKSGWVPGSYFESPTEYYKQRKRTRELVHSDLTLTEEQEAIMKRE